VFNPSLDSQPPPSKFGGAGRLGPKPGSADMADSKRDGTRFIDPDDLAKAERMILAQQDPASRKPDAPRPQFTLAGVMAITFFGCLGLSAGGSWLPAPAFAGVMGILAVAIIAWTTISFPTSPRGRVAWMGIALAYFLACVIALLRRSF
jgi:hypothetical protein